LKLELKGSPGTGMFNVDVLLPPEEWAGLSKKVIRVDAYMPVHLLIGIVCAKVNVKREPHYYELRFEGKTLGDQSYLAALGLGIKIRTIQVQIHAKVFPTGTNPEKDTTMIKSWLTTDFFDLVWNQVQEKRQAEARELCEEVIDSIFARATGQIDKVTDMAVRVATLSNKNREPFLRFLRDKEREDNIKFGKFINMKRIADLEFSNFDAFDQEEEEIEPIISSIPAPAPPPPPPPMGKKIKGGVAVPAIVMPVLNPADMLASRLQAELKSPRKLRAV